jgi:hypothetical protein
MSDKIKLIKEVDGGMVSVPAMVLQDLVHNCELAVAGMGKGEEIVGEQCRELQRYLDGALPAGYIDPNEDFTLEPFTIIFPADFGKKNDS